MEDIDKDCMTLLWAVYDNKISKVNSLLDNGYDINCKRIWSALMWASDKGHIEMIELLLNRGANIHDMNDKGETAMTCAVLQGNSKVIEILENWPVTMAILVLQELVVYHLLDIISYNDLFEFIGE